MISANTTLLVSISTIVTIISMILLPAPVCLQAAFCGVARVCLAQREQRGAPADVHKAFKPFVISSFLQFEPAEQPCSAKRKLAL